MPTDHVETLIDAARRTRAPERDVAVILMLLDTRMRCSELTSLKLADVDHATGELTVVGKGGKTCTVFFGEAVAGVLREYLKKRPRAASENLVIVNSLGEALWKCTISRWLHSYGAAADIRGRRVSPNTLRHAFAVSWLMGGGNAFSLQRLLGRATSAMTARYVNITGADLGRMHRTLSPLNRLEVPVGV